MLLQGSAPAPARGPGQAAHGSKYFWVRTHSLALCPCVLRGNAPRASSSHTAAQDGSGTWGWGTPAPLSARSGECLAAGPCLGCVWDFQTWDRRTSPIPPSPSDMENLLKFHPGTASHCLPACSLAKKLRYHLLFPASFPLVAAPGNLLAETLRGRVWCIFLAWPQLVLLQRSHPPAARLAEDAATLGSCLGAGGAQHPVGSARTRATSLPCITPLWGSAVPLSLDQLMMTGCCYHTFQSWLKIHSLLAIKMRRRGTECRTPRHPITHPGTDDESWSNALSCSTALIVGELPGLLPQQCLPSAVGLLM